MGMRPPIGLGNGEVIVTSKIPSMMSKGDVNRKSYKTGVAREITSVHRFQSS